MSSLSSPRFVKIKRKASESVEPPSGFKKFKFVGSCESGDTAVVKQLIADKRPALAQFDEDLLITDYEDFVFETTKVQLPPDSQGESDHVLVFLMTDMVSRTSYHSEWRAVHSGAIKHRFRERRGRSRDEIRV